MQAAAECLRLLQPTIQRCRPVEGEDTPGGGGWVSVIQEQGLRARRDVFEPHLTFLAHKVLRSVSDVAGSLFGKARQRRALGLGLDDPAQLPPDEQTVVDWAGVSLELAHSNAKTGAQVHLRLRLDDPPACRELPVDQRPSPIFGMEGGFVHPVTLRSVDADGKGTAENGTPGQIALRDFGLDIGQGSTSWDRSTAWAGERCPRRFRFWAWGSRLRGFVSGRSALDRFRLIKLAETLNDDRLILQLILPARVDIRMA